MGSYKFVLLGEPDDTVVASREGLTVDQARDEWNRHIEEFKHMMRNDLRPSMKLLYRPGWRGDYAYLFRHWLADNMLLHRGDLFELAAPWYSYSGSMAQCGDEESEP